MSENNTSGKKEAERKDEEKAAEKAPWTARRIAAVIGIVLLVGLYLLTFISALMGTEGSGRLFRFSLGMTIAVPIFLWIFIWCVGKLQNRHNMASLDILSSNPEERTKMEKAVQREKEAEQKSSTDGK